MTILEISTRELRARDLRRRFLPADVCNGAKWAMLLYLSRAYITGHAVYTSELQVSTGAKQPTAFRYIDRLEGLGLVERYTTIADRRLTLVRLTNKAFVAMSAYAERAAA